MGNDVLLMSSPPISNLHRLFRCRYSNYRDVASSPSFSAPPPECPGELARRLWHRRMERKNPSTPNSRTHNLLFSSPDALPSSYRRLRGGPRGGGGGDGRGWAPLYFWTKPKKIFWGDRPPPPYLRVWMIGPPLISRSGDPALRLFRAEETRTRFMWQTVLQRNILHTAGTGMYSPFSLPSRLCNLLSKHLSLAPPKWICTYLLLLANMPQICKYWGVNIWQRW